MTRPSHALAVALLLGFSFASPSLAADFDGAGKKRAAPAGTCRAAGELLTAMQEARPSPVGDIYRANCVIVISDGLSANR